MLLLYLILVSILALGMLVEVGYGRDKNEESKEKDELYWLDRFKVWTKVVVSVFDKSRVLQLLMLVANVNI